MLNKINRILNLRKATPTVVFFCYFLMCMSFVMLQKNSIFVILNF